jgi:hypothetical protein
MFSRSCTARAVKLTRYSIFAAHLVEDLVHWARAAFAQVFKSLANGFFFAGLGGEVEEALILGWALDDGFGLAVDGEDDGAAGLLEALHELDGVVAEGGKGLDVFGDVNHDGLHLGGILSYLWICAGFYERRFALCANAHISESRYGAPDSVASFRCGPPRHDFNRKIWVVTQSIECIISVLPELIF